MKISTLWFVPLFLFAGGVTSADSSPQRIEQSKLDDYWLLAPELMGSVEPPMARGVYEIIKQRGKVVLFYDMTIDASGTPADFKLTSIEPADVDPRPFTTRLMFNRYKPGVGNPDKQAVRATFRMPFWIPKKQPAFGER